jgi:GAF domain-containing protein
MRQRTVGVDDDLDLPVPASAAALDRLTQLAGRVLDVPIVCASLVDAERRLLTSSYGLSTPTALLISWSFVKEVVASGRPLVVRDGRRHRLVAWNPAVRDGMVTAYVGMPLVASHGRAVGALSVMDQKPRRWSGPQLDLLRKVSARIVGVMEQRA